MSTTPSSIACAAPWTAVGRGWRARRRRGRRRDRWPGRRQHDRSSTAGNHRRVVHDQVRCSATGPPNCPSRSRSSPARSRPAAAGPPPCGGFSIINMYMRSGPSGTKPGGAGRRCRPRSGRGPRPRQVVHRHRPGRCTWAAVRRPDDHLADRVEAVDNIPRGLVSGLPPSVNADVGPLSCVLERGKVTPVRTSAPEPSTPSWRILWRAGRRDAVARPGRPAHELTAQSLSDQAGLAVAEPHVWSPYTVPVGVAPLREAHLMQARRRRPGSMTRRRTRHSGFLMQIQLPSPRYAGRCSWTGRHRPPTTQRPRPPQSFFSPPLRARIGVRVQI